MELEPEVAKPFNKSCLGANGSSRLNQLVHSIRPFFSLHSLSSKVENQLFFPLSVCFGGRSSCCQYIVFRVDLRCLDRHDLRVPKIMFCSGDVTESRRNVTIDVPPQKSSSETKMTFDCFQHPFPRQSTQLTWAYQHPADQNNFLCSLHSAE